jgi:threonine/homoserine/homoserine lactone efflux protein
MSAELLLTTYLAGMLYVLVPGPATLAALSLSANDGREACLRFLGCHLVGDVFWSSAAILAVVGVSQLGPTVFNILGFVCGVYLIYLGAKALTTKSTGRPQFVGNPWRAGIVFGLTNPKAYPFALAMFTAVFARFEDAMTLGNILPLIAAAFAGFVTATALVILWTGLGITRRIFRRYSLWITRSIGVVFILFGAKSASEALTARS